MVNLSSERRKEIDNVVSDVLLQIGYSPLEYDLVQLVESTGLTVLESDFIGRRSISAMLIYADKNNSGNPTVYLNSFLSEDRKRFTLAHELGHYLLHDNTLSKFRLNIFDYCNNGESMSEENEVNYFASAFLVPEESLVALLRLIGTKTDLIANYFGVSSQVIKNRLLWLNINK